MTLLSTHSDDRKTKILDYEYSLFTFNCYFNSNKSIEPDQRNKQILNTQGVRKDVQRGASVKKYSCGYGTGFQNKIEPGSGPGFSIKVGFGSGSGRFKIKLFFHYDVSIIYINFIYFYIERKK